MNVAAPRSRDAGSQHPARKRTQALWNHVQKIEMESVLTTSSPGSTRLAAVPSQPIVPEPAIRMGWPVFSAKRTWRSIRMQSPKTGMNAGETWEVPGVALARRTWCRQPVSNARQLCLPQSTGVARVASPGSSNSNSNVSGYVAAVPRVYLARKSGPCHRKRRWATIGKTSWGGLLFQPPFSRHPLNLCASFFRSLTRISHFEP